NHQPLVVEGMPLVGRAPRFVAATGELFFAANLTEKRGDWSLWVLKEYAPAQPVSEPPPPVSTPSTVLGDYATYAAGPWSPLWDSPEAVKSATVRGMNSDDVTFQNGVLNVRGKSALIGPAARNIAVRMRLKHQEGKGCFLSFRNELTDPHAPYTMETGRYTNWMNGYKQFGLGRHFEGAFTELGGNSKRDDLRDGEYYEWLGVADGDFIAVFINGELLLKMKDTLLRRGYFALAVSDGEATIKRAEYRIIDEGAKRAPPVDKVDDGRPSGPYLVEFQKDQGWSFVYDFNQSTMERRFVKLSGTTFKPVGGEATVTGLDSGKFLLVHKDRGEHELWQPGEHAGTFTIQRGDSKSYLTSPLKGTARKLSQEELQRLPGVQETEAWTDLFNGKDLTGW